MSCEIKSVFEVFKANDVKVELDFTDCETGEKLNIDNAIVEFIVKQKMSDSDENAIIEKNIINHLDPINGKTVLELSREELNKEPGEYNFDFTLVDTYGKRTTLIVGKFIIKDVVNNL